MTARRSLDVWLDGAPEPIGRLDALDQGGIQFCYARSFLAQGQSISLSLPFDDAPIGDVLTRAFFDNLLPENDQLQRVLDRERLDRADLVGILTHVGGDCAGAISCLPVGAPPIKVPGDLTSDYRPLADEEIAAIVRRLADREPLPEGIDDPSPVAGVQRKIAVTLLPDERFALPADGMKVPTTHILKVPHRTEAVEALQEEAACRLAEACGFAVSRSRRQVIDGIEVLLIERFDRIVVGDVVFRLHQEDFAQALGLPASLKYQRRANAGPWFDVTAIRGLLDRLSQPALAIDQFVLATIFNLAIGNTDNHAKNHAVLYGIDGRLRLAPLYDLLPIRLNHRYTDQLAFNIGNATHFDAMGSEDLAAFFAAFGLRAASARRFADGPVREMLITLEAQSLGLRPLGLRTFDDLIGRELNKLSELFGLDLDLRQHDYIGPPGGGWLGVS